MKKFFVFLFMLMMIACDNSVKTVEVEVDKSNTVYDTTYSKKTVILSKNAVYDTVRTKFSDNTIVGSIISKDASVVCSENMNRCAKTNSKGIYKISLSNTPVIAGRVYEEVDTLSTPENVDLSLGDTTVIPLGKDTNIVSDTNITKTVDVVGNDTLVRVNVEQIDTIFAADSIKVEITIPTDVPVKDTLTVVSNGNILREIPINSWGHILDSGFVDKWSIAVYDTISSMYVDTVQFVYFATGDSIAQVVTLGREKINGKYTNRFSGSFFYYWDDSAYTKDKYIHNYFIRAKDSTGSIVSKTEVISFSAKAFPEMNTYLKKNIHVPQFKILPKIIPSAKNNKKLKDAVEQYTLTEDKTKNWIGPEQLPVEYKIGDSGEVYFNNGWVFNFDSLGINKISFDISTASDTILYGYSTTPFNTYWKENISTNYEVGIEKDVIIKICGRQNDEWVYSTVSNIRFYFKD